MYLVPETGPFDLQATRIFELRNGRKLVLKKIDDIPGVQGMSLHFYEGDMKKVTIMLSEKADGNTEIHYTGPRFGGPVHVSTVETFLATLPDLDRDTRNKILHTLNLYHYAGKQPEKIAQIRSAVSAFLKARSLSPRRLYPPRRPTNLDEYRKKNGNDDQHES